MCGIEPLLFFRGGRNTSAENNFGFNLHNYNYYVSDTWRNYDNVYRIWRALIIQLTC